MLRQFFLSVLLTHFRIDYPVMVFDLGSVLSQLRPKSMLQI